MTDKNPKGEKTIVEDRYLGSVLGNRLDAFNNASYNLRLYMIPDKTADGGGYKNGALQAKPEETVIIAQTGVTGIQIDNLSLNIVRGSSGSFVTNGTFTLYQPGAADLLDQIQIAKKVLGIEAGMFANVPIFLEIVFKGYEEDIDDIEGAGAPVKIQGPWCWQLEIATIDVAITEDGSTYDFSVVIGSDSAYSDTYYNLPADTSMTGSTIKECMEDLEETLKKYREDNYKEEQVHDEVVFDLSQIEEMLGKGKIKYSNYENAEQINRLMNAESQGIKTREEYEKILEDNPESLDGGIKATGGVWRRDRIQLKEGTNFHKIFTTLFVMNEDFLEKCTRKKKFDSPEIDEDGVDLNQTFTHWYKIEADIEFLDYDKRRNTYARRVTYKPIIYKTADQDLSISPGEFNLDKDNVTKRVNDMNIKKAYHYMYTGLNDQILKADISYKAGQLLLGAPGGGLIGDTSTSPNKPGAPVSDGDLDGKSKKAAIAAKQEDKDGILKAMDDPSSMQRIQDTLGLTDDEIKDLQNSKEKQNNLAEAIIFLNNNGQNPLGYYKSANGNTDLFVPVDQDYSNPNQQPYTPEASGYLYGADLLDNTGGSETVIGELSGQQAINTLVSQIRGDIATDSKPSFDYTKSVVATSGNTSDGTPKATLFGYMYNNVNDASILVDLGLTVRGDPWFLGPMPVDPQKPSGLTTALEDAQAVTDNDAISYTSNDNYFLFTMQTPRIIDPDLDDEDNNTGYMSKQGTAYFLSGVYQIFQVTANFSNGMFDCELNAKKQTALSLANFDMTNVDYGGGGERAFFNGGED